MVWPSVIFPMTIKEKTLALCKSLKNALPAKGVTFKMFISTMDRIHGRRDAVSRQIYLAVFRPPDMWRKINYIFPADVATAEKIISKAKAPLPPPQ